MNSLISRIDVVPNSEWECKRTVRIDRKTVPKGERVTIEQLTITFDTCTIMFRLHGFMTFMPIEDFRKKFKKI